MPAERLQNGAKTVQKWMLVGPSFQKEELNQLNSCRRTTTYAFHLVTDLLHPVGSDFDSKTAAWQQVAPPGSWEPEIQRCFPGRWPPAQTRQSNDVENASTGNIKIHKMQNLSGVFPFVCLSASHSSVDLDTSMQCMVQSRPPFLLQVCTHKSNQNMSASPTFKFLTGKINKCIKLIRNRQLSNLFQQRAGQTQGPCKPYGNRHTCNHLVCTSSNSHSTCSTGITRAYIQKQCLCRAFLLEKLTQYGFYCFCTLYVHS